MFHNVSKVVLCGGAILLRRFQTMSCTFRGRRSTLATSIVISRGRHSNSEVSCCVFFANRIVRVRLQITQALGGIKDRVLQRLFHHPFLCCAVISGRQVIFVNSI